MNEDLNNCTYCGCYTNAHMRACCNAGRDIDKLRYVLDSQGEQLKQCQSENAMLHKDNLRLLEDRDDFIPTPYTHIRHDKSGELWKMQHVPGCEWFAGECDCGANAINAQIEVMDKQLKKVT